MRRDLFRGDSIFLKKDYQLNLVLLLSRSQVIFMLVFLREVRRNTLANQQGELMLESV